MGSLGTGSGEWLGAMGDHDPALAAGGALEGVHKGNVYSGFLPEAIRKLLQQSLPQCRAIGGGRGDNIYREVEDGILHDLELPGLFLPREDRSQEVRMHHLLRR